MLFYIKYKHKSLEHIKLNLLFESNALKDLLNKHEVAETTNSQHTNPISVRPATLRSCRVTVNQVFPFPELMQFGNGQSLRQSSQLTRRKCPAKWNLAKRLASSENRAAKTDELLSILECLRTDIVSAGMQFENSFFVLICLFLAAQWLGWWEGEQF